MKKPHNKCRLDQPTLTDSEAREALEKILHNHLDKNNCEFKELETLLENSERTLPIRGILESIRGKNIAPYTKDELDIIKDLLYMYG